MKKLFLKVVTIFMMVLIQLTSWAQVESGLHLGSLEFLNSAQMEMEKRTLYENIFPIFDDIPKYIIDRVGGVAFIQTATPAMEVKSIELGCDKDKNAAYVIVNGEKCPIPLPVWQLQPIVEFANDEKNNAAVSIYGEYFGKCMIVYHNAFLDNLLGLRILQSDLLLFEKDAVLELPADKTDNYVMADSEHAKFLDFKNEKEKRNNIFNKLIQYYAGEYETYILSDFEQQISFSVKNKTVTMFGTPYYRFYGKDKYDQWCFKSSPTDSLKMHWNDVYAMNPVVMDAVLNTCQWSAFFRYAKKINSANWSAFIKNVKDLQYDAPIVSTPISYYRNYDEILNAYNTLKNTRNDSLYYYKKYNNELYNEYNKCEKEFDKFLNMEVKKRKDYLSMMREFETLKQTFNEIDENCFKICVDLLFIHSINIDEIYTQDTILIRELQKKEKYIKIQYSMYRSMWNNLKINQYIIDYYDKIIEDLDNIYINIKDLEKSEMDLYNKCKDISSKCKQKVDECNNLLNNYQEIIKKRK
ncbi:MAG: hypothetical protein J6T48_06360 [Bacteroidales bacterium]|nr:hypothetical protein [Bacteroidales bacterium]